MKQIKEVFILCTIFYNLQIDLYAQNNTGQVFQQHQKTPVSEWKMQPTGIQTRWAKDVSPENALPEYPRPQMVRAAWQNLNGLWEYAITEKNAAKPTLFVGKILVPFPLESSLSGVKRYLLPTQRLWYKRSISTPDIKGGKRVLLHFGAVDWQATVYVNGKEIGGHTGGYQNFSFDITDMLKSGNNELIVSVYDPTDQGPNPHGKQVLNPGGIMYTPSSGIWQTVWMEIVPATHINNLYFTSSIDSGHLRLIVVTAGKPGDYTVEATASNGSSTRGDANTQLFLPIPNAHLWSPDDPYLYNLKVCLLYKGKVIDTVGSYFGMRKIEVKKDDKGVDRLFLNNRYTYHLGVLDQGFWPEGLYTAPTDAALQFDIMAIRNMGYNTIRKHVKIEPARWYYHADKIGMLVWQDMVTCADNSPEAQTAFEKENKENIAQLHNYPSIVMWVLFNEGWARYDQQRLTEWIKKVDPSRIVNGHSGENYDRGAPPYPDDKWVSSDLTDAHEYPGPGIPLALSGKARVLGEWGGVRVVTPDHQWNDIAGWGYTQVPQAGFICKYDSMMKELKHHEEEGLSGSIYTEPFDVETEENGIMTYDREVIKIPADKLRQINSMVLPQAEKYETVVGSFKAAVADTANPDLQYATLLEQYQQGRKEPKFLRVLALMASRLNDQSNATQISSLYIKSMPDPFTYNNLIFINQFTKTTQDPGFSIFLNNPDKVDQLLGPNVAINRVKSIIFNEEIKSHVSSKDAKPDWNTLEKRIVTKYGTPGEEILLRAKAIYYLNMKDWQNFATTTSLVIAKYGVHVSPEDLNKFAWTLFENVSDTNLLKTALTWSKKSLQKKINHNTLDTYANLLYKLGNKEEAIEWEKRALQMMPQDEELKKTLAKMEIGEKTWN
jgi:tetratricopeptide (TPR) repeat protein